MRPNKDAPNLWVIVGILWICVGTYTGAYLATYTRAPGTRALPHYGPPDIYEAEYRIQIPLVDREAQQRVFQGLFWPLHAIDRCVRPDFWTVPEIVLEVNSTEDEFDAECEAAQGAAVL